MANNFKFISISLICAIVSGVLFAIITVMTFQLREVITNKWIGDIIIITSIPFIMFSASLLINKLSKIDLTKNVLTGFILLTCFLLVDASYKHLFISPRRFNIIDLDFMLFKYSLISLVFSVVCFIIIKLKIKV